MKVAYYSPLPPERSGIADYSTLLLSALRERLPGLAEHADEASAWGRAGRALAERVTWDACVDALLS